jgi:hypothetical protein
MALAQAKAPSHFGRARTFYFISQRDTFIASESGSELVDPGQAS